MCISEWDQYKLEGLSCGFGRVWLCSLVLLILRLSYDVMKTELQGTNLK